MTRPGHPRSLTLASSEIAIGSTVRYVRYLRLARFLCQNSFLDYFCQLGYAEFKKKLGAIFYCASATTILDFKIAAIFYFYLGSTLTS